MIRASRRRFRRGRQGYEVRLAQEERSLLKALSIELGQTLADCGPGGQEIATVLRRLFPMAYPTDLVADAAFTSATRGSLLEHHKGACALLAADAEARFITDDAANSWLTALNDLRLSIGTSLDVSEDVPEIASDDPRFGEWVCYQYLSFIQSELIDAMSAALPPSSSEADIDLPEDPWGDPPGGLRWDGTELPPRP